MEPVSVGNQPINYSKQEFQGVSSLSLSIHTKMIFYVSSVFFVRPQLQREQLLLDFFSQQDMTDHRHKFLIFIFFHYLNLKCLRPFLVLAAAPI